ncbi:MAG: hypothetical protein HY013_10705 [Candidatus Solibacter usitatus]|nr:hypothetical protein [Candidatus Solibacter usitatus]
MAWIFLVAAALVAAAAGVAGKWGGSIEVADSNSNSPHVTPVDLELEQNGAALTGKIGRRGDADRVVIKNGKVDGNKVYFEASSSETASPMKFTLTLENGKLTGEMRGAVESGQIAGKVSLARQ